VNRSEGKRELLQEAAFELYSKRGFDGATATEIAQSVGLTERTFYRYFPDKRESLFSDADALNGLIVSTIESLSIKTSGFEAIQQVLISVGDFLEDKKVISRKRAKIIMGSQELQERELQKMAHLVSTLSKSLCKLRLSESTSKFLAEFTLLIFKLGYEEWLDGKKNDNLTKILVDKLKVSSLMLNHPIP